MLYKILRRGPKNQFLSSFKVVGLGGRDTLYRPQGESPRLGKKILDGNMGVPYKSAMGTWEAFHVKSGDTVFRLSGLAKVGGGTLYRP